MIRIDSIGIAVDTGTIPPVIKLKAKLSSIGIMIDSGSVPPKNFFKGRISVIGISGDESEESNLFYQINYLQ